jgi:hypothetical protein
MVADSRVRRRAESSGSIASRQVRQWSLRAREGAARQIASKDYFTDSMPGPLQGGFLTLRQWSVLLLQRLAIRVLWEIVR